MMERKYPLRIIGVDPGLNTTGYAVIDTDGSQACLLEGGIVRSTKSRSLESRLKQIFDGMIEVLAAYHPDSFSLEEVFSHYERPKTAILMGHARGVINLAAAQHEVPVHSYAATQVKRMLTGNGRAPKTQVQLAVARHFNMQEPPTPHDIADAMAIALCHAFMSRQAGSLVAKRPAKNPLSPN